MCNSILKLLSCVVAKYMSMCFFFNCTDSMNYIYFHCMLLTQWPEHFFLFCGKFKVLTL